MNVRSFLEELEGNGYRFQIDGEYFAVRGTQKPLTPEILETLKRHKGEILKALRNFNQGHTPPYLDRDGNLVIPFDSHPCYHWWKNGMSIKKIIVELKTRNLVH